MRRRGSVGTGPGPVGAVALAAAPFGAGARPALAHEGAPLAPHDLWTAWTLDPALVFGVAVVGWGYGAGVLSLFGMAIATGTLGALMTFAAAPWRPEYWEAGVAWGVTPLENQQLAGLNMWVPAGAVYVAAALASVAAGLAVTERAARRRERAAGLSA